jgi:hypothetical protein
MPHKDTHQIVPSIAQQVSGDTTVNPSGHCQNDTRHESEKASRESGPPKIVGDSPLKFIGDRKQGQTSPSIRSSPAMAPEVRLHSLNSPPHRVGQPFLALLLGLFYGLAVLSKALKAAA